MTKLLTVAGDDGGRPGVLVRNEVLLLDSPASARAVGLEPVRSIMALLTESEALASLTAAVRRLEDAAPSRLNELRAASALHALHTVSLKAPLPAPALIVCCGNTYHDHAREMGARAPAHPAGFIKSSHTVIASDEPIVLPAHHADHVDFEGELAFVIGHRCHHVSTDEAAHCIVGYVVINDVSARDWVADARATGDMFFNTLGKQFPTFCPMGPWLTTSDEVPDPRDLHLTTRVDGVVMQDASTAQLAFTPAELLSFWSRWYEFQPGDVISTGSPPGVGAARSPPVYLRAGNIVSVEVDGLGALANPVAAASAYA